MKEGAPELTLSDRLNAVLARDVQQMLNGRAFVSVLVLSLLAVALIGALIAGDPGDDTGRDAFQAVMIALAPLLTLIVPMQAFASARQEISGGGSEMLLLSNLTPARIVRGKLLSAAVQIVLWTSMFAPLVAFTFLLRGISVLQILGALALAMLFGLTMSAAGIAFGALTVWRKVAQLVAALSLLVLAVGAFYFTGYLAWGLSGWGSSSRMLFSTFVQAGLMSASALALLVLIACSQFTHPYENRSTGFRCFLPLASLIGLGVVLGMSSHAGLADALPQLAATMLGFGFVFFVFAATEESGFSPRVRASVPRRRAVALLLAPLLPGGGRGLLFSLLTVGLLLAISALGILISSGAADAELVNIVRMIALYGLFYAAIAASIRRRLGPGPGRNWIARLMVLIVLVLGSAAPMLLQAMASLSDWTPLQILNPIWTLAELDDHPSALPMLGVMTAIVMLFQIPPTMQGLREVFEASRHRDQHAG